MRWGVVHARQGSCVSGEPIVLLHQTPRSGDEFAEVIELLGNDRHLIALDLPGMGHSTPHPDGDTIEAYANAIDAALATLGVQGCVMVGHHTGAAVAAQFAASQPLRISHLVLSSAPWMDDDERKRRRGRTGPGVDEVERAQDGGHLAALWAGRASFYPPERFDLLDRFVADALVVRDPTAGHRAVTDWNMTSCIETLKSVPTTIVDHVRDPHAHPHVDDWSVALPHAHVVRIEAGMVPLEYTAARFTDIIREATS